MYVYNTKTPQDFWKTKTPAFVRFCVLAGGIAAVVVGLVTILSLGFVGLLDGLFTIALGYGILARKSRACAVVMSLYYALNQLLLRIVPIGVQAAPGAMVLTYILLGCMVLSIYGTFTFRSLYDEYMKKNLDQLPPPGQFPD